MLEGRGIGMLNRMVRGILTYRWHSRRDLEVREGTFHVLEVGLRAEQKWQGAPVPGRDIFL